MSAQPARRLNGPEPKVESEASTVAAKVSS